MTRRVRAGVSAPVRRGQADPKGVAFVGCGVTIDSAGNVILSILHDAGDALSVELDDAAFNALCGLLVDLEPMRSVGNDR